MFTLLKKEAHNEANLHLTFHLIYRGIYPIWSKSTTFQILSVCAVIFLKFCNELLDQYNSDFMENSFDDKAFGGVTKFILIIKNYRDIIEAKTDEQNYR